MISLFLKLIMVLAKKKTSKLCNLFKRDFFVKDLGELEKDRNAVIYQKNIYFMDKNNKKLQKYEFSMFMII